MLPAHLERELAATTLRIFREALDLSAIVSQGDSIISLHAAIQKCVRVTLAHELRTHTAQRASWRQLPAEIWYTIWGILPLEDRVNVSHVCSEWRRLVLETPTLWNSLDFFSSRHDGACECSVCIALSDGPIFCSRCSQDCQIGRSSYKLLTAVLPRSRDLPLQLRVTLDADYIDREVLSELASLILSHAARLVALDIRSEDNTAFGEFFAHFDELPALHGLICHSDDDSLVYDGFFANDISLPVLRGLELAGTIADEDVFDSYDLSLPAVRVLDIRLSSPRQLYSALRICLGVETLRLYWEDTASPIMVDDACVLRASKIQAVQVLNLSRRTEEYLFPILQAERRPKLMLQYPAHGDAPVRGLEILTQLAEPYRLQCTPDPDTDGNLAIISGTDASGRLREVHLSSLSAHHVWTHLGDSALASWIIDVRLWWQLFGEPAARNLHALRSVSLLVHFGLSLSALVSTTGAVFDLPALETLRLLGIGVRHCSFAVCQVVVLVQKLRGDRGISVLALRRVTIAGDRTQLLGVVGTVQENY